MRRRRKEYIYSMARRHPAHKQNRVVRVFAFTLGFIVFLALSSYGFLYVKKKISEGAAEKRISHSDLVRRIEEIDTYISGALFDLGLSIKDIELKKTYYRVKDGVKWEYKDIKISLPSGIMQREVEPMLKKVLSKSDVGFNFEGDRNSLVSKVEIYGFPTHKISFVFYKNKKRPEKKIQEIVKEKEIPPEKPLPKEAKEKEASTPKEVAKLPDERQAIREQEIPALDKDKPKIVIIVDDLGLNKLPVDQLLEISAKLNFAVLPNLPYSRYAAEMAYKKGWDIILHLPMEPKASSGYTALDAGDGVLFVGLSKNEILSKLESNLASVPYVKGVNNHMGSKFMENGELMELVLQRIKSKGLFFVDSKTSQDTTGFMIAKKLGMRAGERDIFLDQALEGPSYIRSQIAKLVSLSKRRGYAIGICHPYPITIEVLSEMIPRIEDEVELVTVSSVVN